MVGHDLVATGAAIAGRGMARLGRRAHDGLARAALTSPGQALHTRHMKRTNLVLDEQLLQEAMRLSGEATYSRTVGRALEELVRLIRARRILDLAGSGLWEGDLAAMRSDRPMRARKRAAR